MNEELRVVLDDEDASQIQGTVIDTDALDFDPEDGDQFCF